MGKCSLLQQLQIQLAEPLPYDLEGLDLREYKNLDCKWKCWADVKNYCVDLSILIFDKIVADMCI